VGINRSDSMRRLRHKPFLALSLITACVMNMAKAQEIANGKPATPVLAPKVINIWPGVAPGSDQWKQKETTLCSVMSNWQHHRIKSTREKMRHENKTSNHRIGGELSIHLPASSTNSGIRFPER
jgi:hypothetical protein